MKKSKLLIIIGVILALIIGVILFFSLREEEPPVVVNEDALKFKEEYENLNDTYAFGDIKYSSLDINESNPFVYAGETTGCRGQTSVGHSGFQHQRRSLL